MGDGEPGPSHTVRHKALSAYYNVIYTLRHLLNSSLGQISTPSDLPEFRTLLDEVLCAPRNGDLKITKGSSDRSQQEAIDRILQELGRRRDFDEKGRDVLLSEDRVSSLPSLLAEYM
jgi:hypothetical protein